MNKYSHIYQACILFAFAVFVSAGCANTTPSATGTPEVAIVTPAPIATPTSSHLPKDTIIDACSVLSIAEIEEALGIRLRAEEVPFDGATDCRYLTIDEDPVVMLQIIVYTDASRREAGENWTAAEWFDKSKATQQKMFKQMSYVKFQDVPALGDKSYYMNGSMTTLHVLKNGVEYDFVSVPPEFGGAYSLDTLITVAQMAMQQGP